MFIIRNIVKSFKFAVSFLGAIPGALIHCALVTIIASIVFISIHLNKLKERLSSRLKIFVLLCVGALCYLTYAVINDYLVISELSTGIEEVNEDYETGISPKQVTRDQRTEYRLFRNSLLLAKNIQKHYLYKGGVVERDSKMNPEGLCDSLLFTSLRYVSLVKLGLKENYQKAFDDLLRFEQPPLSGRWIRHPDCPNHQLSRDMFLGLLLALNENPSKKEARKIYLRTLKRVEKNNGWISRPRFSVGLLTGSMRENMRLLAIKLDIDPEAHDVTRYSFSERDFTLPITPRGFQLHLHGLGLLLEESLRKELSVRKKVKIRSITTSAAWFLDSLFREKRNLGPIFEGYRYKVLTKRLYEKDINNYFFEFLFKHSFDLPYLKTSLMAKDYLSFLPSRARIHSSCDRNADYLWQRDSRQWDKTEVGFCSRTYSGVDVLFMNALYFEALTKDTENFN